MTVDDVNGKVRKIARLAKSGDFEAAHSEEDSLYVKVLYCISQGAKDGAELASAALKSNSLDFERWCA